MLFPAMIMLIIMLMVLACNQLYGHAVVNNSRRLNLETRTEILLNYNHTLHPLNVTETVTN